MKNKETKITFNLGSLVWTILGVLTAMIGYNIHGSVFWSIMDFFFVPLAWIKWLIFHEVSLSVIKNTFEFFLK